MVKKDRVKAGVARKTATSGSGVISVKTSPKATSSKDQKQPKNQDGINTASLKASSTPSAGNSKEDRQGKLTPGLVNGTVSTNPTKPSSQQTAFPRIIPPSRDESSPQQPKTPSIKPSSNISKRNSLGNNNSVGKTTSRPKTHAVGGAPLPAQPAKTSSQPAVIPSKRPSLGPPPPQQRTSKQMGQNTSTPSGGQEAGTTEAGTKPKSLTASTSAPKTKHDEARQSSGPSRKDKKLRKERREQREQKGGSVNSSILLDSDQPDGQPPSKKRKKDKNRTQTHDRAPSNSDSVRLLTPTIPDEPVPPTTPATDAGVNSANLNSAPSLHTQLMKRKHMSASPSIRALLPREDSESGSDRAEVAISRIRTNRSQPIVVEETPDPTSTLDQEVQRKEEGENRAREERDRLAITLFSTPDPEPIRKKPAEEEGPSRKTTKEDLEGEIFEKEKDTGIVLSKSQGHIQTPQHAKRKLRAQSVTSVPDSQDETSPDTPKRSSRGKGKEKESAQQSLHGTPKSSAKETPKGTPRKKGQTRAAPPRMKGLMGKKLQVPEVGFSWSVESSPAHESPPPESQQSTGLHTPAQKEPTEEKRPEKTSTEDGVFHMHGDRGAKQQSSNRSGSEDHVGVDMVTTLPDVDLDMQDAPDSGLQATPPRNRISPPETPSRLPKGAVFIDLDSDVDEFMEIPTKLAPEPVHSQRQAISRQSFNPDMVEDVEMDVRTSRRRFPDYRSFRPPLVKSNMSGVYADLGMTSMDPTREVSLDWTKNAQVIDKLLNEVKIEPAFQRYWDTTVLPGYLERWQSADRKYFGNDYLQRIISAALTYEELDVEIQKLELTCFALFQEAAIYIAKQNFKAVGGFPYTRGAIRGIFDTYLIEGKSSMTKTMKLLFLFDKICFIDDEKTSGPDKIRFVDWYISRKPHKFSGYKAVLSDTAIEDLVTLHEEIYRRWEHDEYEEAPPTPSPTPLPPPAAPPPRTTVDDASDSALFEPQETGIGATVASSSFITKGKAKAASKRKSTGTTEEADRRAAAQAATTATAILESLDPPPKKTSARSALKKKHNLMADLASEAAHLQKTNARPRFQSENITKSQLSQISTINNRLLTLDQKKAQKLETLNAFTTSQNAKLEETVSMTSQLININFTTQHSLASLLQNSAPFPTGASPITPAILNQRLQNTAIEHAAWPSEFRKFAERRADLFEELTKKQLSYTYEVEEINKEERKLLAQLSRITGAGGTGVTLPDLFLQFAEEMRRWPLEKGQERAISVASANSDNGEDVDMHHEEEGGQDPQPEPEELEGIVVAGKRLRTRRVEPRNRSTRSSNTALDQRYPN